LILFTNLSEWLEQVVTNATPKALVEEATGVAKVLKIFSKLATSRFLVAELKPDYSMLVKK
jgi:hypothetical protein